MTIGRMQNAICLLVAAAMALAAGDLNAACALGSRGGETLKDIDATGATDVSGAINAALASGRLDLHFPKGVYRLDRPLKLPSHAHITADPGAHFYASRENEPEAIVQNLNPSVGDADISICGGLWDGCAPIHPRKGWNDLRYPGRFFLFINVDGLVLEHLRMVDAITYHIALGQVRNFRVEDISFEGIFPVKCQDGIHLCGGCEDGVIRHIRCLKGATYDDLIALNADDAFVYSHNNGFVPLPIRRILVEDVEAPQCHTFVRFLSVTNDITDVTIRDVKVGYRTHGINADAARYCADPIFKDADWPDGVGALRNVLMENVTLWYAGTSTNAREVVTFETNASNFRMRNFTWAKDLEPPYARKRPCFRFRKLCKTAVAVDGRTTELPTGGELTLDALHYDTVDVNRLAGGMPDADRIELEGDYAGHLQDVWWDGGTNIWWAHTHQILRTDLTGKIAARANVDGHNAGCEVKDGVLYVAVCPMQRTTGGKTTPECMLQVNEYDAATLALRSKHVLPVNDRAGSLAILPDGSFVVGCLRPQDISPTQVRLHLLSGDFKLVKSVVLDNVKVKLGIETIKYRDGELFLSMYHGKNGLLVVLDAKTFVEKRRQAYNGTTGLLFDGGFAWCGQTKKNTKSGRFESAIVRREAPQLTGETPQKE